MSPNVDAGESILIVDDEESVLKTFKEWLENAGLPCTVYTASDAEAALVQANQHPIDLAILDWHLGAGNDGLRLLEDLYLFNPNIVAIMITGFAQQATPLDAMRMGIRDYLDKNQDLHRDTFLAAVRRQLERIRPAKRERRLHQSLVTFREAVERVLPLVQSAAALNDPVPLPEAVRNLLRFLLRTTGASDGVLLVRSYDPGRAPAEVSRVYDTDGNPLPFELVPFARSVAGTVVSMQRPYTTRELEHAAASGSVQLQPFERGRRSVLVAPMNVAPGLHAILELFDKQDSADEGKASDFSLHDLSLVAAAADFGTEMLRQALAERQTHQVLFDAVAAALGASESVAQTLGTSPARPEDEPTPASVLDRLRESLKTNSAPAVAAEDSLRLAEAVRVLALRHGPAAVQHCTRWVEETRKLLDSVTGAEDSRP